MQLFKLATVIGLTFPLVTNAVALPVPFTVQAPGGKWVQPWSDACEEASILMIDEYYAGNHARTLPTADAIARMNNLFNLENHFLGHNKDTNAQEIARLINNFRPFSARVVTKPTLDDIKHEIDDEHPVLALVHGKSLHNPYFKNGGPDYHTLVVKGYDDAKKQFITNEPGIGRGLDYTYSYDTLLTALHDFVPGNKSIQGTPVVIFTQTESEEDAQIDADADGVSKREEIAWGSNLSDPDTDHDGFFDGVELENGYSPVTNESELTDGALIRLIDDVNVYQIKDGLLHHVINESVFVKHGWHWSQIRIVGPSFFNKLFVDSEINE